jgi:TPR repeat protein
MIQMTRLLEKLYCFEIILFNAFAYVVFIPKIDEFYQKACGLNVGEGCSNLGFSYDKGKGVKQDDFKAVEFYQKACDLHSEPVLHSFVAESALTKAGSKPNSTNNDILIIKFFILFLRYSLKKSNYSEALSAGYC